MVILLSHPAERVRKKSCSFFVLYRNVQWTRSSPKGSHPNYCTSAVLSISHWKEHRFHIISALFVFLNVTEKHYPCFPLPLPPVSGAMGWGDLDPWMDLKGRCERISLRILPSCLAAMCRSVHSMAPNVSHNSDACQPIHAPSTTTPLTLTARKYFYQLWWPKGFLIWNRHKCLS